jgi:hypothetical protein
MRPLRLRLHPGAFSVCRLPAASPLASPAARDDGFYSVTRTPHEVSIVCRAGAEPAGARVETGWALLEFEGPFAFYETGILASVLVPLAEARIGIFALSTFDTDWLLLPAAHLEAALAALTAAGHQIARPGEIQ